jgi:hypothetical protein
VQSEELNNLLLFPFLEPIVPWHLAVVIIVLTVSVTPRVELADTDS